MKRTFASTLAIAVTLTVGTLSSYAGPQNGDFEAAGFEGWRVEISRGSSSNNPRNRDAGTVKVSSAWSPSETGPLQSAIRGSRFATLASLPGGNFTGRRSYQISITQEITLHANDYVSGFAAFYNGDFTTQDSSWVKIFDSNGNLVANPWKAVSGCDANESTGPLFALSAWDKWAWRAPSSGNYTLSLGVTTSGDNNYASYGFFDDILVVPAGLPVPEPSALSILVGGAAILASRRRNGRVA